MYQLFERLRCTDHPNVVQNLVPKTRIEQMQHGMFATADVEIHRHPVALFCRIDELVLILRINESQIIPAGPGPLRHRVGFTACRRPTDRIGRRQPVGSEGYENIPVSLACAASCAIPLFFSPVRIGGRHYIDGGLCELAHLDVARDAGARLTIVINPRVPVSTKGEDVPTGHGPQKSVRDKGLAWVMNQAKRISSQAMLEQEARHPPEGMRVLVLEPLPTDSVLFLHNMNSFENRRAILEYAYRTTRQRVTQWFERHADLVGELGWRPR